MNIVVSGIHYPMSMMLYFIRALKRRQDVDLFTIGPYTRNWIPWNGGMFLQYDNKYDSPPEFQLTERSNGSSAKVFHGLLPWEPDIWIQVDAGFHFSDRPPAKVVVLVETDPHVLRSTYKTPKDYSDISYCMQTPYMEPGERWLPYAFDPTLYYPENLDKLYDACLIGLHYSQRDSLVQEIQSRSRTVYYGIGEVFDEYRKRYNQSKVALSWSSLADTPTRVFEAFGMGLPLISNRLPDLATLFKEGTDYLGFSTAREGADQLEYLLDHPDEAKRMAMGAHIKATNHHTWDHRIATILEDCEAL